MRSLSVWFSAPDGGDYWTLAAVLALSALLVIILEIRERWRNPILIQARCVRIVGPLFEGDPEPSPSEMPRWMLQFRLSSRVRKRIDRSSFEAGPIVLSIGEFALLTGAVHFDRVPVIAYRKERSVELRPQTVDRGTVWRWAVNAVGDEPAISISSKPPGVGVRLKVYPSEVSGSAIILEPFGFTRHPRRLRWMRHHG